MAFFQIRRTEDEGRSEVEIGLIEASKETKSMMRIDWDVLDDEHENSVIGDWATDMMAERHFLHISFAKFSHGAHGDMYGNHEDIDEETVHVWSDLAEKCGLQEQADKTEAACHALFEKMYEDVECTCGAWCVCEKPEGIDECTLCGKPILHGDCDWCTNGFVSDLETGIIETIEELNEAIRSVLREFYCVRQNGRRIAAELAADHEEDYDEEDYEDEECYL
jgi:hypothetical protein